MPRPVVPVFGPWPAGCEKENSPSGLSLELNEPNGTLEDESGAVNSNALPVPSKTGELCESSLVPERFGLPPKWNCREFA
jgi:hypothetical protein